MDIPFIDNREVKKRLRIAKEYLDDKADIEASFTCSGEALYKFSQKENLYRMS